MKRILLILFITFICLPDLILAQQSYSHVANKSLNSNLRVDGNKHLNSTNSVFDLKFDYTLSVSGSGGITWTYSDFWVSKWQSDTVFIIDDSTGVIKSHFFINGVTGIRGMAFDGKDVWIANNTPLIFKVDTSTKAIIDTLSATFNVRGITYDSSANGGAGGLWASNFATDILLYDLSGNIINSIPMATHGLTGMYGIAFDPWSTGGPYIWVFDQGPGGSERNLVRIPIATGIPDVVHNAGLEIGGNGRAAGLAITGFANPGPHTIIGVTQASPDHVFGLELGDYTQPDIDASADSLRFTPPFLGTPSFMISPINWELLTSNKGVSMLDTIYSELTVNDSNSNVFTTNNFITAVPSHNSIPITFPASYTPPVQAGVNYRVTAIVNTKSQTDTLNRNDTTAYSFSITDTTMRLSGAFASRIGIGDGTGGSIGLLYEMPFTAYATSATFTLGMPTMGDSVYAELFDINAGMPNNLISRSATYIITAADTNGVILTLPFLSAPIQLSTGSYVVGIHEHNFNVSIAYSTFNWHPNTTWIYILANGWRPSENYNFKIVPFINLNVWSQDMVSVGEIDKTIFSVYPSPGSTQFIIDLPFAGKYNLTIMDVQGKIVYQNTIEGQHREAIITSKWSNGLYFAKVESNGKNYYAKVLVSH